MATQQLTVRDRAQQMLDAMAEDLTNSLPDTVDPKRFRAAFTNLAVHNPSIFSCSPDSLRSALLKCAVDGLVPDGRLAAIVQFNAKTKEGKWVATAQYIPMYQGLISRARELGETFSVTANVVYQNDVFQVDEADPSVTVHKRPPLNQDRGGAVGAYCIFRDNEGRVIHREIMDLKELQKVQAVSRAKEGPWKQWPDQMMRKTPIRRGSKYVPMSDALRRIVERDDELTDPDADNGLDEETNYNPLTGKTIEHQPKPPAAASLPATPEKPGKGRPAAIVEEPSSEGGGAAPAEAEAEPIEDDGGNPPAPPELPLEQPPPVKEKAAPAAKTPGKPAMAKDKALGILRSYNAKLDGVRTPVDVTQQSGAFWSEMEFPDESTKLGRFATELFKAHMARVQGKGSPAEVDAVVKRAEAEATW